MRAQPVALSLLAMTLFSAACTEPVKSDDVLTDEMVAGISVLSDGDNSLVTAAFTYGSNVPLTYVQLGANDTLTATVGEDTEPMDEFIVGDLISYTALIAATDTDTEFVVALERAEDESAMASTVTLPPVFEFSGFEPQQSFSRTTEALTISWEGEGVGDKMLLGISGECVSDLSATIDDTGSYLLPADSLSSEADHEDVPCDINISLKRVRSGELDVAYAGGTIDASQLRAASIEAAP